MPASYVSKFCCHKNIKQRTQNCVHCTSLTCLLPASVASAGLPKAFEPWPPSNTSQPPPALSPAPLPPIRNVPDPITAGGRARKEPERTISCSASAGGSARPREPSARLSGGRLAGSGAAASGPRNEGPLPRSLEVLPPAAPLGARFERKCSRRLEASSVWSEVAWAAAKSPAICDSKESGLPETDTRPGYH